MSLSSIDPIVSLCKRRGLIFQSSEIYGGLASTWDYGPLGALLKRNVKDAWWRAMIEQRDDIEPLDASILMHSRVWEASGHVENFNDPMMDCRQCRKRFRADHLWAVRISEPEGKEAALIGAINCGDAEEAAAAARNKKYKKKDPPEGTQFECLSLDSATGLSGIQCPECGTADSMTDARRFNLMFRTFIGPVEDSGNQVYLRPETAQGIFANFENVLTSMRRKLPFGIAQIGKSFRNEVTTKSFTFRTLEFEQMELEFFVPPEQGEQWYQYWRDERFGWYARNGIRPENLRLRDHDADELAHYSTGCCDVEYRFPFGWSELEGVANRTDFDLKRHAQFSGKRLEFYDNAQDKHIVPYVIEPSAGADRATLAFLCDAYREEQLEKGSRVVLGLHPDLAPIKAAVFPLLRNRPELVEKARALSQDLRRHFFTRYDDTAAIGKLYRRQDEIGTPLCITVDVDSLEDQAVTVRHRDTMAQDRVSIDQLPRFCQDKLQDMREEHTREAPTAG